MHVFVRDSSEIIKEIAFAVMLRPSQIGDKKVCDALAYKRASRWLNKNQLAKAEWQRRKPKPVRVSQQRPTAGYACKVCTDRDGTAVLRKGCNCSKEAQDLPKTLLEQDEVRNLAKVLPPVAFGADHNSSAESQAFAEDWTGKGYEYFETVTGPMTDTEEAKRYLYNSTNLP